MKGFLQLLLLFGVVSPSVSRVWSHEEPTSFIDLRVTPAGMEATVMASVTDLAHDLAAVEPATLLTEAGMQGHKAALAEILLSRLKITEGGIPLKGVLRATAAIESKRDMRFVIDYPRAPAPGPLAVACRLFPYDARHRTFLNVYNASGLLQTQEIFEGGAPAREIREEAPQDTGAVIRQFTASGIHHIFIGPDHILFVVGLLLLGGGLKQLLKIVTAFTLAHSVTLGLATFHILSPPASLIEPVIALSIVFVGVHALLSRGRGHDPRILFAFGFGLIHGFGFAGVLQEMELPRQALGWSLLAFNAGVEIGQACIVLTVAPALALLQKRSPRALTSVTAAAALLVTGAGAFWFFQRVLG